MIDAADALERLLSRSPVELAQELDRFAIAYLEERWRDADRHERAIAGLMARDSAIADELGRKRLMAEVEAARARETFAAKVPFEEAIADLEQREPTTEQEARGFTIGKYIKLARAATVKVVERVKDKLLGFLRRGATVPQARVELAEILKRQEPEELSRAGISPSGLNGAYAETVYRTQVAQAFTAGRVEQARDPGVRDVVAGWRFDAVMDSDTRPNHAAAHGLTAAVDDPVWNVLAPPLGFNCRCNLSIALPEDLRKPGKGPSEAFRAGARADSGFLTEPRSLS